MNLLSYAFNSGPVGLLLAALQLFCIVHALSQRRDSYWIWIILFLPGIGSLVYLWQNVRPSVGAQDFQGLANQFKGSQARIRDRLLALEEVPTMQNRLLLAQEYRAAKMVPEALEQFGLCRTGIYAKDAHVGFEIAGLLLAQGKLEEAKTMVNDVLLDCPTELRNRVRLLSAQIFEQLRQTASAESAFREALTGFPGEECRTRLAVFLQAQGRSEEARKLAVEVVRNYNRSTSIYRRTEHEWFVMAQKLERDLKAQTV
jgi:hypothetical protein